MIKLKDISIGFKDTLFNIEDLELFKGKLVVLIGPNGSGKTTFFNTLLGVQPALSGKIKLNNQALISQDRGKKTSALGFVPSRFEGVEHLTVRELIAMGRAPYTNMLNRLSKKDNEIIDKVIEQLNLLELQHKSSLEVSDGERQIAMIGKVLTQSTDAILLDEPTAFLDYSNRIKILKLLKDLAELKEKLIIVSSHDIELCMEYADEIIAIESTKKEMIRFELPFDKHSIIDQIFD